MTDPFEERVRRALRERAGGVDTPPDAAGDIRRRARRQRRRRAGVGLAVVAVLGLAGAAALPLATRPDVVLAPDGGSPTPTPSPEPTAEPEQAPADTASCEGRERGVTFRVRYPESWWVSDGTDAEPCRWFHPEPFDMPTEARDVPGVAIHLGVVDTPLEELRRFDSEHREVRSESETSVDGRPAVVQEWVDHLDTLYPAGTTFYRFLVEVDGRTLSATTEDAGTADYDERKAALDTIRAHLEVVEVGEPPSETAGGECSAAGHDVPPAPQEGLPLPVAETRAAIVETAAACDYERLAELAGEGFTYSFGGGGDVAGFLRRREDGQPPEPLRYLVGLLDRPYGTVEVEGRTQYVWPSAFAYDEWAGVPDADREALTPLYDEESFASFARFGGYTGYRVGIDADGRWRFFVSGD